MSPQLGTTSFTRLDLCTFMCQILLHGYLHGWHFYTGILHTWVHFYTGIFENDKGPSVVLQMSSQLSTAPLTGLDFGPMPLLRQKLVHLIDIVLQMSPQ